MQINGQVNLDTSEWEAAFVALQDARFDAAFDSRFPTSFDGLFGGRFADSLKGVFANLIDAYRGEFNVRRFGALGDGLADDTAAIQAAIDAAGTYVAEHKTAGVVFIPPGLYRVTRTILVQQSGIHLRGAGSGGDDWAPLGSALIPDPGFANDTYVLKFDWSGLPHCLMGNRMQGLTIMRPSAPFTNIVHGVFWGVHKGTMHDVHVQGMSGRGLGIQGYSTAFKAQDNRFVASGFRRNGIHGIEMLGSESDNWFHMVKSEGNVNGSGLKDLGANNYYNCCHFTGNLNNVSNGDGGTEAAFVACNFETPSQHNVLLDVTNGALSRLKFIGCQFNSNRLDADNLYDSIFITRNGGANTCSGLVTGCTFTATATNRPRYHINLSGPAAYCLVVANNTYGGVATANINHPLAAVRCLVNGLGKNVGSPAVAGAWFGFGEEGVRVINTNANTLFEYANAGWRQLN